MPIPPPHFSLDHDRLREQLADGQPTLFIQDVDGVCMKLVRDPLQRRIDPCYVEAAAGLDGAFRVLTNGEHVGRRGLNGVVERAFGSADTVRARGLYLPGLAAGGVQAQDRFGQLAHPGVRAEELAFLAGVPERAADFLARTLRRLPVATEAHAAVIEAAVLDNALSPTVNLNPIHPLLAGHPASYAALQRATQAFMDGELEQARRQGLSASFHAHYAPNLGREADGRERLLPGDESQAGTTDFQLMLAGAIKETGVLALLDDHVFRRDGHHPLGAACDVRAMPQSIPGLLALVRERFDLRRLPRLVGVGDTIGSHPMARSGGNEHLRGGSDRGFLTLIQELGALSGRDNQVLWVDSSDGEVPRPRLDEAYLRRRTRHPELPPWPATTGISDAHDPLRPNYAFPGGPRQYVSFFIDVCPHLHRA